MRIMKFFGVLTGIGCLLTLVSSCVKNDLVVSCEKVKATNITINVSGVADKLMSRAGDVIYSPRTDLSRISRLDIVLADGATVKMIVRFDKTTSVISPDDFESTGIVSGSLPVNPADGTTTGIKFRISPADMDRVTDLYIVANYISQSEHALIPLPDVKTISELDALKQGSPGDLEAGTHCTMFGHISMKSKPESSDDMQKAYTVFLKRTVAMITLAIDGTGLYDGVIITPISAKLYNVPSSCSVNEAIVNKAGEGNVTKEGNSIIQLNNRWGAVCNATTVIRNGEGHQVVPYAWPVGVAGDEKYTHPDGPHGTGDLIYPLFMFENKQGTGIPGSGEKPEIEKKPVLERADYCSYIEILASYRHSTQLGGSSKVGDKVGNITYRFYLGCDVISDFNIERNKHYMLTLQLRDWGGLAEDGHINDDGSWNAEGGGVSWRINTLFQNAGVVDDLVEVPANGARVDIGLVGYDHIGNNVHLRYGESGLGNQVWVKSKSGWTVNPSEAKLSDMLFKNSDGTYSLHVYVKPVGKVEFEAIGESLSTVDEWMEKGYKDHTFEIKGAKDPSLNVSFSIRQWLPVPVMDPADVGTSTNPNDAKLYFSRFDIYHGKIMPWCHEQLQGENLWDNVLVTDAESLKIWSDYTTESPYQTYDGTNGFHKTVSYFATNVREQTIAQIQFNDGLPETMLAYVFFVAANAEAVLGNMFVEKAEDATFLTHYGLPSIEEWEKIERYGRYDGRYPLLSGVQYWTSTIDKIDGTKTMVYMMGTGAAGATSKARGLMYPGRLVYRKEAKATPQR